MPDSAQVSPVLALYKTTPGQYLLRLHELTQNASLISMLVKQLPGIHQLIVVTPLDTKVFNVPNGTVRAAQPVVDEHPLPVSSPEDELDPMEQAIALAEEAERPVEEAPTSRRRKGSSSNICARCRGSGQIQQIMESGVAANVACGVCRGSGKPLNLTMNVRGKK